MRKGIEIWLETNKAVLVSLLSSFFFKKTTVKMRYNYRNYLTKHCWHMACTTMLCIYLFISPSLIQNTHMKAQNWVQLRERMVNDQLRSRDIRSSNVLNAMREVPRHHFVTEAFQHLAYDDRPLPIGMDQTISQPYIVAFMTEQIQPKPGMKVLEIGTGSGYQAAVLAHLGCKVFTIELLPELAQRASNTLTRFKI
jgi:protein-L-isoaspartate(D-aspartate) O-methyltransferase